jgi:hypothetical protein
MCKASIGTNALNEGSYVESGKEEQVEVDNETQVELE